MTGSLPRKKNADAAPDLFNQPAAPARDVRPVARSSDPDTSKQAAKTVNFGVNQKAVLECFKAFGAMYDAQLVDRYPAWRDIQLLHRFVPMQTNSGLRSRRAELVRLGYLRDSGRKALLSTKRNAIIWEVR